MSACSRKCLSTTFRPIYLHSLKLGMSLGEGLATASVDTRADQGKHVLLPPPSTRDTVCVQDRA